jgi:hypothetical protein
MLDCAAGALLGDFLRAAVVSECAAVMAMAGRGVRGLRSMPYPQAILLCS